MKRPGPRAITEPVVSDVRFDKNGPPPFCVFTLCANYAGKRRHITFRTKPDGTLEQRDPYSDLPCDGACRGWFTIKRPRRSAR